MATEVETIHLLEAKLQSYLSAQSHPLWTLGGEQVLIGDVGFADVDGERTEVFVTAIDADANVARVRAVWLDVDTSDHLDFGKLLELTTRGRMPKAGEVDLARERAE